MLSNPMLCIVKVRFRARLTRVQARQLERQIRNRRPSVVEVAIPSTRHFIEVGGQRGESEIISQQIKTMLSEMGLIQGVSFECREPPREPHLNRLVFHLSPKPDDERLRQLTAQVGSVKGAKRRLWFVVDEACIFVEVDFDPLISDDVLQSAKAQVTDIMGRPPLRQQVLFG